MNRGGLSPLGDLAPNWPVIQWQQKKGRPHRPPSPRCADSGFFSLSLFFGVVGGVIYLCQLVIEQHDNFTCPSLVETDWANEVKPHWPWAKTRANEIRIELEKSDTPSPLKGERGFSARNSSAAVALESHFLADEQERLDWTVLNYCEFIDRALKCRAAERLLASTASQEARSGSAL